ncbi:MAG: hypothetical protein IMZ75_00725, partial [Actinobacteria bacterium]|nr:hypothetical protein [Actinomycetota bacterium]
MHDVIVDIAASLPYRLLVLFFGLYPMVSALMWIGTSFIFFFRRERRSQNDAFYGVPEDDLPFVSVVIPAFSEELTVCETMAAMIELDYPRLE